MSRPALTLLACAALAAAAGASERSAVTLTWDDNLSNSDLAAERIDGLVVGAELGQGWRHSLGGDDSLLLDLRLGIQASWDHKKLDEGRLGTGAGWEHKFGLGAFAPVLGAGISVEGVLGREGRRDGIAGTAAVHGRYRLTGGTLLELREEFTRREARGAVFDAEASETVLTLTQDAGESWQFTAEGRLRHGDIVSFAVPPRPDLVARANALASLDTFGAPRTAYSIDARSVTARLTAHYRTAAGFVFSAGFEHRDTRRGSLDYANRRWIIGVGRRN